MKRIFDVILAGGGLLTLWPLFLVVGLLIKLDSPGPVFYRGIRTGLNGRPFRICKFRTMVVGAETLGGGSTARDDPRVTHLGRILRRHKLDELPQLLNVLRGEMSLVGPRPELEQYARLYEGDEKMILSVRPGITDYASIEFANLGEVLGNDDPDRAYEKQVRPVKNALRVKYVREKSFKGDLAILLKTLRRLLRT